MRLKQTAAFAQAALRSRLAWILVCLHAAWFFLAIANMAPPSHAFANWLESGGSDMTVFARRPFHFTYQSLAIKSLVLGDMPAELAEIPIGLLAKPLQRLVRLGLYAISNLDAALMLLFASCQWLTIGKLMESWLSASTCGKRFLGSVHRYFVLVVASVLLFTAIATPIVNARSQRRASRHSTN